MDLFEVESIHFELADSDRWEMWNLKIFQLLINKFTHQFDQMENHDAGYITHYRLLNMRDVYCSIDRRTYCWPTIVL